MAMSAGSNTKIQRNELVSSDLGEENLDSDGSDEEQTPDSAYGIISTSRLRVLRP
jgi:hypothetical protein